MVLRVLQVEDEVASSDLAVVGIIVASAMLLSLLLRPILRRLMRWLAGRSLNGVSTGWQLRAQRLFTESADIAELRRSQRIDATASVMARLIGVLIWVFAAILILRELQVEATIAISGAGFLGAGLAFGGQHSVNDFFSGMHILLEDRFGEGDELKLKVNDDTMTATVVSVGVFATRLESEGASLHIPNRDMSPVVNLSQRGITTRLPFTLPGDEGRAPGRKILDDALRRAYFDLTGFDPTRDGLILDYVDHDRPNHTAVIRTARPLTASQRNHLTEALIAASLR